MRSSGQSPDSSSLVRGQVEDWSSNGSVCVGFLLIVVVAIGCADFVNNAFCDVIMKIM